MVAAAQTVPPGAEGVLFFPYLAGAAAPFWQGEARGAFCGLTLATTAGHLTRAVLEAAACDLQASLAHMQALDCGVERLVLFGGGARTALWPEIIAAVCDLPVLAGADTEAASRGAAMLAGMAVGRDPSCLKLPVLPVRQRADWRDAYAAWRETALYARSRYFACDEHLRGRP
jgi:sugar (pentulose or hexulose) kinase